MRFQLDFKKVDKFYFHASVTFDVISFKRLLCERSFVNTALRNLRWVSGCTGIHTGPSLRFPMASSQSFLLAVSSRISCCCCSDSWKVSSIFTRLEGGSAAGGDSAKDTQRRVSKLGRIKDSGAYLRKTLVDIKYLQAILRRSFTAHAVLTCPLPTTPCLTCFELHL